MRKEAQRDRFGLSLPEPRENTGSLREETPSAFNVMFCQHSVSHSDVTFPWLYSEHGGRYGRTPMRVGLGSKKNLAKDDTLKSEK